MANEVLETGFRRPIGSLLNNDLSIGSISDVTQLGRAVFPAHIFDSIGGGNFLISAYVESIANGLRNREPIVQSGTSWNASKAVDDTPRFVEGDFAGCIACGDGQRVLEADCTEESNECGGELSPSLISEHCSHHCSTPFDCSELAGNDTGQWVISPYTRSENNSPEDHYSDNVESRALATEREGQSSKNNNDQRDSIHLKINIYQQSTVRTRLRPTWSANIPKKTCPRTVPEEVAILIAVSSGAARVPDVV